MLALFRINFYKHLDAKFSKAKSNFENPRGLLLRLGAGFTGSSTTLCFRYLMCVESEFLILVFSN